MRPLLDDDDGDVKSCNRNPQDRSFGANFLLISFVMPNIISMTDDDRMDGWIDGWMVDGWID